MVVHGRTFFTWALNWMFSVLSFEFSTWTKSQILIIILLNLVDPLPIYLCQTQPSNYLGLERIEMWKRKRKRKKQANLFHDLLFLKVPHLSSHTSLHMNVSVNIMFYSFHCWIRIPCQPLGPIGCFSFKYIPSLSFKSLFLRHHTKM